MAVAAKKWVRHVQADSQGRAQISGRKIYILPTKFGTLFGILVLLLLVGSVNYANNPAFLLTFLLAGLGSNSIYLTWRNLNGLTVRFNKAEPVFAGQTAQLQFHLIPAKDHSGQAVQLAFGKQEPVILDCIAGQQNPVILHWPTQNRGLQKPGRLTVETRYPLGLLRAWSYLDTSAEVLVYPKPGSQWQPDAPPGYRGTLSGDRGVGTDDFVGHHAYLAGDQPRHIDWKAYASEKGLLTKRFGGDRAEQLWLDLNQVPGEDIDQRLAILTRSVIDLEQQQLDYGLRLDDREIEPARGSAHQLQCLRALALYGNDHG